MGFNYLISSKIVSSYFPIDILDQYPYPVEPDIFILKDNELDISIETSKNYSYQINYSLTKIFIRDLVYIEISDNGKFIRIKELNYIKNNIFLYTKLINHIIPYSIYMSKGLVFHSSGIANSKDCVLFLGSSGSGKSSLAASLSQENFYCMSEDATYIKNNEAYPSSPLIKLSDDMAYMLDIPTKDNIKIPNDRLERSLYKCKKYESDKKNILKCYFLEWGDRFSIDKISSAKKSLEFLTSQHLEHFQ